MTDSNVMKHPPKFNVERSFERYKDEVICWSEITSIEKGKRGTLLVLSLPDTGRYGDLRGKCMDGCNHKGDNGLENVLKYLEEHIGQGEVSPEVPQKMAQHVVGRISCMFFPILLLLVIYCDINSFYYYYWCCVANEIFHYCSIIAKSS